MDLRCVVLAAGQGTRMKSKLPKVLHPLVGRPMLQHVLAAVRETGVERPVCVIGFGADAVRSAIDGPVDFVLQEQQLGTGHAVMQAGPLLAGFEGDVLIVCGDTPLLTAATLGQLIDFHRQSQDVATILTAILPDPTGYGRIIREPGTGEVLRIVEQRDATEAERSVQEINTGIYCFRTPALLAALRRISPNNAQGEYYLTDVIGVIRESGGRVGASVTANPDEVAGVNSREQLAGVEKLLRRRKNAALMAAGVTITDPDSTYIDPEVSVGRDTVILPNTCLFGRTVIGGDCALGPNLRVDDSVLGDRVQAQFSVLVRARVADDVSIGPFAYLRPEAEIGRGAKIGDFVEIKKSVIGPGSKVPHHSYIGDAEIGAGVNIGAGTITCNYDGRDKHRTVVEDGAFVGANTNLVAPVRVGKGAYVASGSTITKEVPALALGIGRARQANIEEWVPRKRDESGGSEGADV